MKRRGFLSIAGAALGALALPDLAEPISPLLDIDTEDIPAPWATERVVYALGLTPDRYDPIEPGKVIVLRARPDRCLIPDRLLMSAGGFSLLHLSSSGDPLLEHEVPSELFSTAAVGPRMMFSPVDTDMEIIVAAVNRNPHPQSLRVSIIGRSMEIVQDH